MSSPDYKKAHLVLIGDSIAQGFSLAKPYNLKPMYLSAIPGRTPKQILGDIKRIATTKTNKEKQSNLKGAIVVLSTGWSNKPEDHSNNSDIQNQFKELANAGVQAIYVLGVASNFRSSSGYTPKTDPNTYIKEYISKASVGVPVFFCGGFTGKDEGKMRAHANNSYYTSNSTLKVLDDLMKGGTSPVTHVDVPKTAESKMTVRDGREPAKADANLPFIKSTPDLLEEAMKILPLLKERESIIKNKNNGGDKKLILTNDVDNALKGIAIQIDTAKNAGYPSMGGKTVTKEDQALYSQINDNYLNNYLGYSYSDLGLDAVVKGHTGAGRLTREQVKKLQQVEPTFFINSDPVVNSEVIKNVVDTAMNVDLQEIKDAMGRGFWDKALGVGIDATEVTEDNEEHGMNMMISAKLKETQYISVEDEVTNSELAQQSGAQSSDGSSVSEVGQTHNGTNSTYTGEFPTEKMKRDLGSLQASKNTSIGVGYPPAVRALMDFVSRMEGTHEVKGKKGYGQGYGSATFNPNGGHPKYHIQDKNAFTASGRYQFMSYTWKDLWGSNKSMAPKNQDEGFKKLILDRDIKWSDVESGNFQAVFNKRQRARGGNYTCMGLIWASIPENPYKANGRSQQKAGWTIQMCIEACKHLQKFYEGAAVGERAPIREVEGVRTGTAKTSAQQRAENTLAAGAPRMLNTETKVNTYELSYRLEMYGSQYRRSAPDDQFKGISFQFVQALTGNIFVLKSNSQTPKYILVQLRSVRAPNMKFKISMPRMSKVNDSSGKEVITIEPGMGDGADFQAFGVEARNIANTLLSGATLTSKGGLRRANHVMGGYLLEVPDLYVAGKSVSAKLVEFGAGVPKSTSSDEVKQARLKGEKANSGAWGYQSAILNKGTNEYTFKALEEVDSELVFKIKKAVGMTPKAAEIITHEKQHQKALQETTKDAKVVVANNLYTADSKPMKAARIVKQRAHGRSQGLCARYVRTAMQKAGYKFTHPPSAYQYHTNGTMVQAGFKQIKGNTPLMPGDVLVYERMKQHPHAHIQMVGPDGAWYSDFKQNSKNIYSDHTGNVALYRDAAFVKDTGAIEHSGWSRMSEIGSSIGVGSAEVAGDDPNYIKEAQRLGVYQDLSNYTIEQVEGHRYEEVEVDDSFSVFGQDAKVEQHIKKLMYNYSKGLNVCFPVIKAYVVLGNEDDDMFVEGVPLNAPAYYELPPLQSFNLETNNDYNPLDVCVFSCINPSATRSAMDDMSSLTFATVPELIGTQWFNPVIASKLNLVAGMKVHIKAGYSNDPNKLVTIFNGFIKETSGNRDFMLQCVCESFGVELLSQQLGPAEPTNFAGDHNASTGLLFGYSMLVDNLSHFGARLDSKWHLTTAVVGSVVKPLAVLGAARALPQVAAVASLGLLGSSLLKYFGAKIGEDTNSEGIQYMNTVNGQDGKGFFTSVFGDNIFRGKGRLGDFRDPENKAMIAPISAGGYLWNIFNLSRGNLSQRVYTNIYAATIEKVHGDYRDTVFSRYSAILSFNRKFKYRFYVVRSTVWVILKEMEYRHPGTLTKPLWYEERQTLFYGTKEQCYIARDLDPFFMNRAGQHSRYDASNKPYVDFYLKERKKRFDVATGYHYLSTKTNIISSNIKLSKGFATKINTVFYEDSWKGGIEGFNEKSDTIVLDKTLAKHDIREKTISLGGIHGAYMSWVYGTQELKKELETMYDGHIILTGDPTIRAGDYAYISDTNRGIYGTIKIRECSHHFSAETGYTTIIKPGLFVEATHFMWDDFFLKMNLACSILDTRIRLQQDMNLQGNEDVYAYINMLKIIGENNRLGIGDYLHNFAGFLMVAGMTWASVKTLTYTAGRLGLNMTKLKAATAFGKAYGQTAGKGVYEWAKSGARGAYRRTKLAHLRTLRQVTQSNAALRGNVKAVTNFTNKASKFVSRSIGRVWAHKGILGNVTRLAWSLVLKVGAKVLAHPIVAIVAAVVGVLISWGLSAVRKMKMHHNAITYFPLSYNGKPYQAGVAGWSGKGQWDAMFENLRRNARALNKAARMLDASTSSLEVNGSLKTKALSGTMNFLAGLSALPNDLAGNNNGLEQRNATVVAGDEQ